MRDMLRRYVFIGSRGGEQYQKVNHKHSWGGVERGAGKNKREGVQETLKEVLIESYKQSILQKYCFQKKYNKIRELETGRDGSGGGGRSGQDSHQMKNC